MDTVHLSKEVEAYSIAAAVQAITRKQFAAALQAD
jgi:hypothetical protein